VEVIRGVTDSVFWSMRLGLGSYVDVLLLITRMSSGMRRGAARYCAYSTDHQENGEERSRYNRIERTEQQCSNRTKSLSPHALFSNSSRHEQTAPKIYPIYQQKRTSSIKLPNNQMSEIPTTPHTPQLRLAMLTSSNILSDPVYNSPITSLAAPVRHHHSARHHLCCDLALCPSP
jgi:hypothetical protein